MTDTTPDTPRSDPIPAALPFWLSLALFPVALIAAVYGGLALLLVPVTTWYLFAAADLALGDNTDNPDPQTGESALRWHRRITLVWPPLQAVFLVAMLAWIPGASHLSGGEKVALFFGVGILTGTIGITYSHELMHQSNRTERWLGDVLLGMVLYSHFRSEHLLVHHRHVGTPRDPVSARYNEGFFAFFARVLWQCPRSAFRAETALLARRNLPWHHRANPFWRYAALQALWLGLAFVLGGWAGLGLFFVQAITAIWQLELINYIEHYGLTRRKLPSGKYEPVRPHHSWNAAPRASNWLLINLQRHSDHHTKPDRRFPLLQTYTSDEAPQLPHGYPVMSMLALVPPAWRRVMNPRVRAWRRQHYPDVTDWAFAKG